MTTARPHARRRGLAALVLVLAAAGGGAGCGEDPTAVLVTIRPDPNLTLDALVVSAVGRGAAGATCDLGPQTYPVAGFAWPQSIAVLAGARCGGGVDLAVVAFDRGLEVGRGGAAVRFAAGGTVAAEVTLRAACRGVVCEGRAFCGAGGACVPAARRLAFAVNAVAAGDQATPAVTAVGDAGFVVVWVDAAEAQPQLRMRRFDADGLPQGEADQGVAPGAEQAFPAITADPAGAGFVVAWAEGQQGLRARRFDAAGAPLGAAEAPAPGVTAAQIAPALASSPQGLLLAWQDARPPAGTGFSVMFRRLLWQGTWMESADYVGQPPTAAEFAPAVAGSCNDAETFLVAWRDTSNAPGEIRGRWVAGSPPAAGQEAPLSTGGGDKGSVAAATGAGASVIVWDDLGAAAASHAIRLRRCGTAGALLTPEVEVATLATSREARPAVGVAGTTTLVAWESVEAADDTDTAIRAQRFVGDAPDGESFLIAPARAGAQALPRIAGAAAGFLVVWQELGSDGASGGLGIRARLLGVHDAP
ncbi:MAG TPA: hypothetical protein VGQ83_40595 [Polyangia bacterium]